MTLAEASGFASRKLTQWIDVNRRFLRDSAARAARVLTERDYTELEEVFCREYEPCFVLSTGRCGTDYLTHVLESSRELAVYHTPQPELRFYKNSAHRLQALQGNRGSEADETLREIVRSTRFEILIQEYLRQRRYVETNNSITFLAPQLAELFPRARFVHLIRHPALFARSGMRRGWYTGRVESDMGLPEKRDDPDWRSLPRLAKIGWLWEETNGFIRDFGVSIETARFLLIKSEEMFGDVGVLCRIFRFIGAEPPTGRRLRRLAARRVNVQVAGEFPIYDEWSDEQRETLRRSVTLHDAYGYRLE